MVKKGQYWRNILTTTRSLLTGLGYTFRHMREATHSQKPTGIFDPKYFDDRTTGIATISYPHQVLPVPDNGRYRLHNEIDDCIVCDKCAKICPVNCIDIEPIKATEEIGKTSDGTAKRIYPAKFDIDMGKCCFCGLCTTVCPTECLTMTKVYDFSTFDIRDHKYAFGEMTLADIAEKQKAYEAAQAEKAKAQAAKAAAPAASTGTTKPAIPKPAKPAMAKPTMAKPKPSMPKPTMGKPAQPVIPKPTPEPPKETGQETTPPQNTGETNTDTENTPPAQKPARPVFRPKIKRPPNKS